MTMDEHDETIAVLRGVAAGGREATPADVAGAKRVGRRMRRQRRALQAMGSGFVLSAGLGLFVVAGGMSGQGVEVVPASPAAPPAESGATPGPVAPGSKGDGPGKAVAAADAPHEAYVKALLKALGPDFRRGTGMDTMRPGTAIELIPGSPTAKELPSGYGVGVQDQFFTPDRDHVTISSMCKPMVEKGSHESACRPLKLANGRVVEVQDFRTVLGEFTNTRNSTPRGAADGTQLYFQRTPDSFVRLTFLAYDDAKTSSTSRQKAAVDWLGDYTQTLAAVLADPAITPDAPSTSVAGQTDHDRDQAILQKALGGDFTLFEGTVRLEPGSVKYAELPGDTYDATAELSKISSAAFHAACDAKAGLTACETKTLDDGTVVHLRSWADRDATANQMRGESAVYLERKDGRVLLANLEVTGRDITAAQADKHAAGVREWMDSLQSALITAITDPDVVGTPAAS
jgi:hypothetical protein